MVFHLWLYTWLCVFELKLTFVYILVLCVCGVPSLLYVTEHIVCAHTGLLTWPFTQVYVNNSGKQKGLSQPFGYLKASTNLTHVTLFVMPYNYPSLLPLIGT